MTLSTAVGKETFQLMPTLVADVDDEQLFRSMLAIATEIARRSAKHSAEFLKSGGEVSRALREFASEQVTSKPSSLPVHLQHALAALPQTPGLLFRRQSSTSMLPTRFVLSIVQLNFSNVAEARHYTSCFRVERFCAVLRKSSTTGSNCCGLLPSTGMRAWLRL
jgi:hypothetical protein